MQLESVPFDVHLDACVLCGGRLARFQSATEGGLALSYEGCKRCGLVQMNPRPSEAWIAAFYEHDYRAVSGDANALASSATAGPKAENLRSIIGTTPSRHLDVGCSTGTLLRTVGAEEQVGVEPGASHREIAAGSGLDVFADLDDLMSTSPRPFDLISLVHVLEHVADPVQLLRTLRDLLAPGGRLLVEVPNLPQHRSYELGHVLAFTRHSLVTALAHGGFAVDAVHFHNVPQGGLGRKKNLLIIARAGQETAPGTAGSLVSVRMQRWAWVSPSRLRRFVNRQGRRARRLSRTTLRRIQRRPGG